MTAAAPPSARLLIAEDDRAIRDSLQRLLAEQGYEAITADDGAQVLEMRRQHQFDAYLLDVMMPEFDGLTVCKVIRAEHDTTPILMLTARTETADRIAGLDAGADDYLAKPFDPAELLARVRALLRRSSMSANAASDRSPNPDTVTDEGLSVADLRLDPAARRVFRGDREIHLSKTEFDLLELLMLNSGIVLERGTIYDRIWGYDFGPDSKNLAVYISYLRRKIDEGEAVPLIHTVRGVGYTARVS